ncbi:MAG TPA: sigma-54 dependent transcriptional regulator [Candidatus Paceibacterota bacterium]|nr:sigma-54 dependent transcriptional regulator [Verrucomicrobiota bacterium]HSA11491.1 sigma-54 dependent transcriptional regulator [Candidatus Paceibacterota bacterium]
MKGKILIVDDDAGYRKTLTGFLEVDHEVSEAESGAALKKALDLDQPDVVLLDVDLKDANGLEMLPSVKKRWPETEVIVLTGAPKNDAEAVSWAVAATKRGAFNFIRRSGDRFDGGKLLADVSNALEARRHTEETSMLRRALETMSGSASPVFHSAVMREVVRTIERIAPSDVAVLITGESGTGKEVIADLLHTFSPRSKGRIIKINCAALPRELIESELFGSVKGAYTGAHADREGLFRLAEGGTLLLDEISEMPIDTQSKLLRVLQDQEVRPVGGKTSYKTNCRLVASTNRKTREAIDEGKLREDLFYRISAISVHLPPLRERREDIMPLANAFLKRFSAQANRVIKGFTPSATERLTAFDWPGNIRQLQNEVQRAVLLSEGNEVDAADLSISTVRSGGEDAPDTNFTLLEGVERNAIVQMLQETGGNKLETAKRLGIGRQTLYNKIKAYGIDV